MIYSSHEINPGTAKKIMNLFPKQRGNVKLDSNRFPDAIIYICENGCKWRALPETFSPWHTVYVRINRWAKNGVPERIFQASGRNR
jgi:transposase